MKIRESVKELCRLAAMIDPGLCATDPGEAVRVAWVLAEAGEGFVTAQEETERDKIPHPEPVEKKGGGVMTSESMGYK